jgi:hypothetical protein
MKKVNIILVISLFVMAGCGGESKQSSDDFLTVDVTASYPKKELILQDFLDVEYIPLETNDEFITSTFIQTIGKDIIIVKNFVRRGSEGDIFVFNRNGIALRKINRLGQGGEEYIRIQNILLDEELGEMFVNDIFFRKIFVYDLFGNFKRRFNHIEGTSPSIAGDYLENIFYDQVVNFDQNNLIIHDGVVEWDESKRSRFLIISKEDGSVTKEIQILYKEKKTTIIIVRNANGEIIFVEGARNKELIPYRDSWILVEPSSDTIYSYSADHSMRPFIVRTPSIQSMDPEVFLFPGVLTERYYFLQTVKKEADVVAGTAFPRIDLVYDRQEKAIYESTVYNADFTNKKPINMVYGNDIALINNNEIAFVQRLEAFDLVEAYGKGELKGRLKDIAAELDEESNPVIMLAKYKK